MKYKPMRFHRVSNLGTLEELVEPGLLSAAPQHRRRHLHLELNPIFDLRLLVHLTERGHLRAEVIPGPPEMVALLAELWCVAQVHFLQHSSQGRLGHKRKPLMKL